MLQSERGRCFSAAQMIAYCGVVCGTALAAILFYCGVDEKDPYLFVLALLIQFVSNILFALVSVRERLLSLFLYFGIALFLLSRPFIGILYGNTEWLGRNWDTTVFSFEVIHVSLVFVMLGGILYSTKIGIRSPRYSRKSTLASLSAQSSRINGFLPSIREATLLLFVVGFVFSVFNGLLLLSYMQDREYTEFFLAGVSDYSSGIISALSSMTSYALAMYLATLPSRRSATLTLCAYVITTIPKLLIGSRSDFVLALVFFAFYYCFRQSNATGRTWITRRVIVAVLVGLPVGIIALGVMNYVREGSVSHAQGAIALIGDALYKQGVSFKVLQYAYGVQDQISALGPRYFVFGSLINYVTQGPIGQLILGCPLYPPGNNTELALNGSQYAHTMSYFAHSGYLSGHGYGSSYLLEAYADGGIAEVIGLSLALGFLFSWLSSRMTKNWFITFMGLMAGMKVFHMARGSALEWISYLWSSVFVFTLVAALLIAITISGRKIAFVSDSALLKNGNVKYECMLSSGMRYSCQVNDCSGAPYNEKCIIGRTRERMIQ